MSTSSQILHIYNTKSRNLEPFEPLNRDNVLMYTCGPTVYHYAHIGNLRTYVFEDVLRKTLETLGYQVNQVMNITDVDDKTIRNAIQNKQTLDQYVSPYIKAFFEDLEALSIQKAAQYPRATDYIDEMIRMIERLIEQGIAYIGEDQSVYFSISKFPHYGQLSGLQLEDLQLGASGRVENDEYEKDTASDFVLWKAYQEDRDGDIYWESPFGKGRPGWHIECSAMATALLGKTLDIHCGGVDNIFPHHENEIAQSECCSGQVFSRFWVHSEHLLVNNQKMSKSLGNFYTLRDLIDKGYTAREVRFLLLQGHYRTQLNFTLEGLKSARSSLERIDDFLHRLKNHTFSASENLELKQQVIKAHHKFQDAILDDLNVAEGLAILFNLIRYVNSQADQNLLSEENIKEVLQFISFADAVLSIVDHSDNSNDIPADMQRLLDERNLARDQKDWSKADALRDAIEKNGYLIEDSPQGSRLKRKAL